MIWLRDRKFDAFSYDLKSKYNHPVALDIVENTDVANNYLDSITSIKGAYFLKSIYELIGQQNYQQAIQNYIEQFKWGNATSVDFISCFQPFLP